MLHFTITRALKVIYGSRVSMVEILYNCTNVTFLLSNVRVDVLKLATVRVFTLWKLANVQIQIVLVLSTLSNLHKKLVVKHLLTHPQINRKKH